MAVNAASPYVTRAVGNVALRVTDAGSTREALMLVLRARPTPLARRAPSSSAGVNNSGSAFSVSFSACVAGSLQAAILLGIIGLLTEFPLPEARAAEKDATPKSGVFFWCGPSQVMGM